MQRFLFGPILALLSVASVLSQNPPQPTTADTPSANPLANYSYALPPQWTRQELRDRILLTSPTYKIANPMARPMDPKTENCQIALFAMHPATRPMGDEAVAEFSQIFHNNLLTPGNGPATTIANGISPQGWEYFYVRKLIGGQEGEVRALGATFLLAKVGDQYATIAATSKDFLWSACFSERTGDAWYGFFYSLQFKNAQPSDSDKAMALIKQKLVGDWTSAGLTISNSYNFQANGRYSNAGATKYYLDIPAQQVAAGGGVYAVKDNALILTSNENQRSVHLFRIGRVSKDNGRSWHDQLCMKNPASQGELCYDKR